MGVIWIDEGGPMTTTYPETKRLPFKTVEPRRCECEDSIRHKSTDKGFTHYMAIDQYGQTFRRDQK